MTTEDLRKLMNSHPAANDARQLALFLIEIIEALEKRIQELEAIRATTQKGR